MKNMLFPAAVAAIFLAACNGDRSAKTATKTADNTTSGTISISVDESFRPLVEAEIKVFEAIYEDAHVRATYKPESEALRDLLNDSARLVFVSRELNENEIREFEEKKLFQKAILIAYDGISVIANKGSSLTFLSQQELSDILSGKIRVWKQIPGQTSADTIRVVFDNPGSGTVRYLKDSLLGDKTFSKNCFAVNSNPQVIDYVEQNPAALGIIGVSWISDVDDTLTHTFLNKIKVLEIESKEGSRYTPHKGYVAKKVYPLWRPLYIISREPRAGLGTGFASFVASDPGQRIVLKAGLVPATMPIRLIVTGE